MRVRLCSFPGSLPVWNAFMGEGNPVGVLAALAVVIFMLFMLFRPYSEAKDAQREKGTLCCVMAAEGKICYPGLWGNLATILIPKHAFSFWRCVSSL